MVKYLVGLGVLVVVGAGYILLIPAGDTPAPPALPVAEAPSQATEPAATTPMVPDAAVRQAIEPAPSDEEVLLAEMAADIREGLPMAVTDTLTLNDALFLPRMRIMEYSYVTTASDARATAGELRALINSSAATICLEGRQMFLMGATLRNSFKDRDGNLFQRVYVLPEDCRQFY